MRLGAPLIIGFLALTASATAETLLLRNARIYTVGKGVIERGDILIRDGRIAAVGTITPPSDARVMDFTGKTIMPGIVDANAHFGVSDNEQSSETTSRAQASHLIDPRSPELRRALLSGTTSACITPGSANVLGGVCAAVRMDGTTRSALVIKDSVAVRASLGADVSAGNSSFRGGGGDGLASIYSRRPNSRMGTVWELRKAMFEADKHPALARAMKGEIPLRIHARTENDIRVMFTLMDEFKLKRVILDDAIESYKVADQLAARRIPVVLGPLTDPQGTAPEGADALLNTAGLLASRGVKVAFGSNGGDAGQLRPWAALAFRNGLPHELALRAITLTAAEVTGIADRVGSIEKGKDADLLILSGDPLQLASRIEMILSRGQVVYHAR